MVAVDPLIQQQQPLFEQQKTFTKQMMVAFFGRRRMHQREREPKERKNESEKGPAGKNRIGEWIVFPGREVPYAKIPKTSPPICSFFGKRNIRLEETRSHVCVCMGKRGRGEGVGKVLESPSKALRVVCKRDHIDVATKMVQCTSVPNFSVPITTFLCV